MVDHSGRDNPEINGATGATLNCEEWEALLADRMDGALAPEAEAGFVEHSRSCPGCSELLEQASQGRQWIKLLEEHAPAAPVDLLSKILARTQGAGREADFAPGTSALAGIGGHAPPPGRWGIPFLPPPATGLVAARGAHNARMLMTAGMAFFSVALTLSVAGVRLNSVHAAELRPQAVQANVSRSFYGTKKQVVSFYENLRLVYEVESKMHDIRREAPEAPARHEAAPAPKNGAKPGSGDVQAAPKTHAPSGGHAASGPALRRNESTPEQGQQVLHGWPLAVNYVQRPAQARFENLYCLVTTSRTSAVVSSTLRGATSKERNRL
jgi:hypothetical protein